MSLAANTACLDCGRPVHSMCHASKLVRLDCEATRDGGYAYMAGVFHRVVQRGEPSSVYTIKEEYTQRLMRFADHATTCTSSLRPEPAGPATPTRDIRPKRKTMAGFGGGSGSSEP